MTTARAPHRRRPGGERRHPLAPGVVIGSDHDGSTLAAGRHGRGTA